MHGSPKIGKTAIFKKVNAGDIAAEIISVQPMSPATGKIFTMGLGPPVCKSCMIIGTLRENAEHGPPWVCASCMTIDLGTNLWNYPNNQQDIIYEDSKMRSASSNIEKSGIKVAYTLQRPFMSANTTEPNDRYRPWLEEHVGRQGVDWEWDLLSTDYNTLQIAFASKEHATLFELSWP